MRSKKQKLRFYKPTEVNYLAGMKSAYILSVPGDAASNDTDGFHQTPILSDHSAIVKWPKRKAHTSHVAQGDLLPSQLLL